MRHQIKKRFKDFIAVIVLVVLAVGVTGYILSQQRLYLPAWVPVLGTDFYNMKAEFETAQAVTPGQGQTVNIAGVKVGDITNVSLVNGRAVVDLQIERQYVPIYKNARMALRPKTAANDMVIELDPGSDAAPKLPEGGTLSISRTEPSVNLDEVLSSLDTDTRNYLKALINGGGEGLKGQGNTLAQTFRRFEPTARDLAKINALLAERRTNIARSIHNFSLLAQQVGSHDRELAQFIDASNAVFTTFAEESDNIAKTVQELPETLRESQEALKSVNELAVRLGPTFGGLRPAARALEPALVSAVPFFNQTTPVVKDKLRPFARASIPAAKELAPIAADLVQTADPSTTTLTVVNNLLNILTYNPPGDEEGFLFWLQWGTHNGVQLFTQQDAGGVLLRTQVLVDCAARQIITPIIESVDSLRLATLLTNLPTEKQACDIVGVPTASAGTP